MVTKLLSRAEMLASPEALEAIKQEATGLQDVGVWDSSTVREKAEVAAQARQSGTKVHFGQLMTIASIKFYELAKHLQKVKGASCSGETVQKMKPVHPRYTRNWGPTPPRYKA